METIKEIKEIKSFVKSLDPKKTILFFDIDKTLIRMKTDIFSDEWIKWQLTLLRDHSEDHPHRATKTQDELFDLYHKWMKQTYCETDPVEQISPNLFNELAESGFTIILLTARNVEIADVTFHQLKNHYDLNKLAKDIEFKHDNFIDGIFFVNAPMQKDVKNKGKIIREIMSHLINDYKHFVFVDDSLHECNCVMNEFEAYQETFHILHYVHGHTSTMQFDKVDKNLLHLKFIEFKKSCID